jgi:hypothetical protein
MVEPIVPCVPKVTLPTPLLSNISASCTKPLCWCSRATNRSPIKLVCVYILSISTRTGKICDLRLRKDDKKVSMMFLSQFGRFIAWVESLFGAARPTRSYPKAFTFYSGLGCCSVTRTVAVIAFPRRVSESMVAQISHARSRTCLSKDLLREMHFVRFLSGEVLRRVDLGLERDRLGGGDRR